MTTDPAETHVGATLVYMGATAFCLVQCVAIDVVAYQKHQKWKLVEEEGGEEAPGAGPRF
jgi:hypothetical protein